jgi:Holliday junction resolvasome RuvABC ATP-dependent DNA helicase subunit
MEEKFYSFNEMAPHPEQEGRVAQKAETDEDVVLNISLRPTSLDEFVGQGEVVGNLKVSLTAAK